MSDLSKILSKAGSSKKKDVVKKEVVKGRVPTRDELKKMTGAVLYMVSVLRAIKNGKQVDIDREIDYVMNGLGIGKLPDEWCPDIREIYNKYTYK